MSEPNDTREEVVLPPFDERAEQTRDYWKNDKSGIGVVCVLQGELSCRDRQLKAALSVIERLNEKVANAEAFELLADAANREQKAEIERLRGYLIQAGREAGALLADEVSTEFLRHVPDEIKLKLASLRASVGEEPEDAWKRGYVSGYNQAEFDVGQGESTATVPDYVAPPTLPGEEK